MKIFRISPDFRFQSFYTSDPGAQKFSEVAYLRDLTQCKPMLSAWKPLRLVEESPKLKRGNFAHSWGGGFIADTRAIDTLRPIIEESCELLPLEPYKGEALCILNVLTCIDCLDEGKTKRIIHSSGTRLAQIEEYHFAPSRIAGSSLFKLPKQADFLTVTGLVEPASEFKSIVEREGLTGLKFEELWSSS